MTEIIQDRTKMTLAEFRELPENLERIELIHGELLMSPTPKQTHQGIVGQIFLLLNEIKPNGTVVLSPSDLYLAEDVVQPDIFWLRSNSETCKLGEDDYWHGAPDLVIEVLSPSTAKRDKTVKFELYQANKIPEYWIVDPYNQTLEVFSLREKSYEKLDVYSTEDSFDSPVLGKTVEVKRLIG